MSDSLVILPTLADVGQQPEIEMAACKPEIYTPYLRTGIIIREIPAATPHFRPCLIVLPTVPDVSRQPEICHSSSVANPTFCTMHAQVTTVTLPF